MEAHQIASDLSHVEASQLKEKEADARIAENDLGGALQCLTKAIFLRPEHMQLYDKRAQVYIELCDIKSAIANYRKLFVVEPNPPQRIKDQLATLLDLQAYSLLCLGESPRIVLGYLDEAIQMNAQNEIFWFHRAVAKVNAGNFEGAVRDVDHCILLNNRDVEYFVLRAQLHRRQQMRENAAADIRNATRLQPNHPEVLGHGQLLLKESQAIYEQARIQLMAHQHKEAIEFLSRASEITPGDPQLYLLRSSAYRGLGEYHMALQDTEKALSCYHHRMDSKKVKIDFQNYQHRTVEHQPALHSNLEEYSSLSYCDIIKQRSLIFNDIGIRFLIQKAYQLAVNAMNLAIRGHAEIAGQRRWYYSPQLYIYRGDAYRGLGNFQAALADYHCALEMDIGDQNVKSRVALIHYYFGVELFNKAQFDRAEIEFDQAIEQNPNLALYHARKGDTARYLDKHQNACNSYQQALLINPDDTETLTKLRQYDDIPYSQSSTQPTVAFTKKSISVQSCSPQHRLSQKMQATVNDARKSYKKTNQRVQDLYNSRPAVRFLSFNKLE
ncbi:FOG: TPR repeat [Plasmopara halstedii]|uniref:FOG: TPR repeat n=1 Tax=Plasmopara halstedii TaxID=4781 RepID=A0A0P1AJK6_PLAHL|nr:FOG: TPR repeat [Plasmopara halstedii]CEG40991.1 FOG: TPR repeat [Plasmopara halstedii]|eukprot:XP_024577360.1 FOG: TPR repeat [Plasmopara halstedii]